MEVALKQNRPSPFLDDQIRSVQNRTQIARFEGVDPTFSQALEQSLRLTDRCKAAGYSPEKVVERGGFGCTRSEDGATLSLLHGRKRLPISSDRIRKWLYESWLDIRPGQTIVLDSDAMKILVERGLGELGRRTNELDLADRLFLDPRKSERAAAERIQLVAKRVRLLSAFFALEEGAGKQPDSNGLHPIAA